MGQNLLCIGGREGVSSVQTRPPPAVVNGPCSESNERALNALCDGEPRWRRRLAKRQRGKSVPTTDSSSCKRAVLERVLFIAVSARTPRLNAPKGSNCSWMMLWEAAPFVCSMSGASWTREQIHTLHGGRGRALRPGVFDVKYL